MVVIAHNIRSLHNVGAIFRSAGAFNVEKVCLTGYTECPPRKEIAKVALGAERLIPWEYRDDLAVCVAELKTNGYSIVALETGGQSIQDYPFPTKTALLLGNEVEGLTKEEIALSDVIVEIPMGHKRSLNVSVAAGIAMYVCACSSAG